MELNGVVRVNRWLKMGVKIKKYRVLLVMVRFGFLFRKK